MDLSKVGRNDPCPCGSGKKFKRCHLGRENELLSQMMEPNWSEISQNIKKLPPCSNQRANEIASLMQLRSSAGKDLKIKLVDLDAYRRLDPKRQDHKPQGPGGVPILSGACCLSPKRAGRPARRVTFGNPIPIRFCSMAAGSPDAAAPGKKYPTARTRRGLNGPVSA